ncbi:MAG: RtcB family protein [Desulfonatronovibrionaceae bacterium]
MQYNGLEKRDDYQWELPRQGKMNVPGLVFAGEKLLQEMEKGVLEQVANVAVLPGIVRASMAMPDAHWGYGFPIGGVAAFDPDRGGVVSAGGVGFDIACGVRSLLAFVHEKEVRERSKELADELFRSVPAGLGSQGGIILKGKEMESMLERGAVWAVSKGYGTKGDLERIEEGGRAGGALVECVSKKARERQKKEMGTLGSGNHYVEVQAVREIFDEQAARAFGLRMSDCVVSIHCGSRGLGHQIGTDYIREMGRAAKENGIYLPARELACAPIHSPAGRDYLGAMRCGINCALANRQIITHLVREAFDRVFPGTELSLLYDVSHNTCREEKHQVDGKERTLFVHRKGATRAFGPGYPDLPPDFMHIGQPVLVGGSMGTSSYVLAGTTRGMELCFGSACHGAGRSMSRRQAQKTWPARDVIQTLQNKGIEIRGHSMRGLAEEAPGAYKIVEDVVQASENAGLARKVARLEPLVCIKG